MAEGEVQEVPGGEVDQPQPMLLGVTHGGPTPTAVTSRHLPMARTRTRFTPPCGPRDDSKMIKVRQRQDRNTPRRLASPQTAPTRLTRHRARPITWAGQERQNSGICVRPRVRPAPQSAAHTRRSVLSEGAVAIVACTVLVAPQQVPGQPASGATRYEVMPLGRAPGRCYAACSPVANAPSSPACLTSRPQRSCRPY